MKVFTLKEITESKSWIGLGIAGNQAGHLNQAGETNDFKNVVTEEENAPKGLFPWYLPGNTSFLGVNPLSSSYISLKNQSRLQIEPEIALIVKFDYSNGFERLLDNLTVIGFSTFNDCSRRVSEPKISKKKNWGENSTGMAKEIIGIDDFSTNSNPIKHYRLTCYLIRNNNLIQYGEDTAVSDYCYFNEQLTEWMVTQINTQRDHGPLENLSELMTPIKPEYGVIGIGATCYSAFGNSEERFLLNNDEIVVIAYDPQKHVISEIEASILDDSEIISDTSLVILKQNVVI